MTSPMVLNRGSTIASFSKPIAVAYSEDLATKVRRDLRTMTRHDVAFKYFADRPSPLKSLRAFCKARQIPYSKLPPSTRIWASGKLVETVSGVTYSPHRKTA